MVARKSAGKTSKKAASKKTRKSSKKAPSRKASKKTARKTSTSPRKSNARARRSPAAKGLVLHGIQPMAISHLSPQCTATCPLETVYIDGVLEIRCKQHPVF